MIVGLLLMTQTVAVVTEETDLEREEMRALIVRVETALAAATGRPVIVDAGAWLSCDADDRCISEIRAHNGTDEILFLRVLDAIDTLRLIAERHRSGGSVLKAQVDLARDGWGNDALDPWVKALFPEGRVETPEAGPAATVQAPAPSSPMPWVVGGIGGALLISGAILLATTHGSEARLMDEIVTGSDYEGVDRSLRLNRPVSGVLLGLGIGGIVTAVILALVD